MDYEELLNKINKEFPEETGDLIEGLELVAEAIDNIYISTEEKINNTFYNKQFQKISQYTDIAEEMGKVQDKIYSLILTLNMTESQEEIGTDVEQIKIPFYGKYIEGHKTEHTLYENLTFKKPFGFKFNDQHIIRINTWTELLVRVSEYLIAKDEQKFLEFENNPSMNGRKKHFSYKSNSLRSPKKVSDKIYIETNQSGNATRDIIIKMLKAYDIDIKELKIYF